MDFETKVEHFLEEMEYLGVSRLTAAPIIHRFLWQIGFDEKPPLFSSYLRNFFIQSLGCVVFLIAILAGLQWVLRIEAEHVVDFISIAFAMSGIYGLITAHSYRNQISLLSLPDWDTYLSERYKLNRE